MGIFLNKAFVNQPNTSLLSHKLEFVESFCQQVIDNNIDGIVAEAGVYKGGSARLIATAFANKPVHLFDSFEGMLEDDEAPSGVHKKGHFSETSLEEVKNYLKDLPNCIFHKGWFPETANFLNDETFCFVHLDMDFYQSTKHGIDIFWPRLNKGGVMILDDWEWYACPGVKQAALEFFNENIPHTKTIEASGGTCAIIKH